MLKLTPYVILKTLKNAMMEIRHTDTIHNLNFFFYEENSKCNTRIMLFLNLWNFLYGLPLLHSVRHSSKRQNIFKVPFFRLVRQIYMSAFRFLRPHGIKAPPYFKNFSPTYCSTDCFVNFTQESPVFQRSVAKNRISLSSILPILGPCMSQKVVFSPKSRAL